ncbi:YJR056C [Zygosaccharomyces parabailii]|uniref:BN860_15566g1_1 n=1 Tax=Zygosaccharomyces bailii (strain CLIB 213 / ATCC 58445 / CBS 680 / BCRC 21525 / NBRC 1098 / NCYC 1416 / NRRL Y-2227) TaxID=1333698 RepID=A0A8J2T3Z9_ZYGB2|nr:YJR056C [Zygosaccharomyces parabailii]CDF88665.1 BN860_15566g1_1 [Zygosaccharomyces bailii CLIB 213]SJM82507.1 uncharacterized protein ZBIST_0537 [Zygosaccharomyces bailii]
MERLNALGSSLPPEQPPTNQVIESLNSELSQEFKLAANAVTKLYRVANERNSLLKHQGYLHCLEDVLSLLEQNPEAPVDAIHLWCLKQRNDMLSHGSISQDGPNGSKFDFNFDNPNVASTNNTNVSVPKFRSSHPPLSVEHNLAHKAKKTRWTKRHSTWAKEDQSRDVAKEESIQRLQRESELDREQDKMDSMERMEPKDSVPKKKHRVSNKKNQLAG